MEELLLPSMTTKRLSEEEDEEDKDSRDGYIITDLPDGSVRSAARSGRPCGGG